MPNDQNQTPEDMLGMDDTAFMSLSAPPVSADEVDPEKVAQEEADKAALQQQEDEAAAAAAAVEKENLEKDDPLVDDASVEKDALGNPVVKDESTDPEKKLDDSQKVDDKLKDSDKLSKDKSGVVDKDASKEADKSKEAVTPPNYEEMYNKIMAPLKANGKTIELKSPEEAIQLMQMGANYTKKMQAIQPHRKVLMMLENNGLLDEGKLSYLIDLDKKNPDAIKKLVKDSGIDPLQIDTDTPNTTYNLGNHRVSDEEAVFVSVLEDLKSTQEGAQTLQAINTWDQASKEMLWKHPELMTTIHEQRANGIYNQIAAEVERQRTLGAIPSHVTFLNAYKVIGDQMDANGAFAHLAQKQTKEVAKEPVVTRVQQPKPVVKNGEKVSAATPSRSSQKKAEPFINPLSMSDEEFSKQFATRL